MWHVCFCVLSDLSVSLSSKMPRWDPEDDATTDPVWTSCSSRAHHVWWLDSQYVWLENIWHHDDHVWNVLMECTYGMYFMFFLFLVCSSDLLSCLLMFAASSATFIGTTFVAILVGAAFLPRIFRYPWLPWFCLSKLSMVATAHCGSALFETPVKWHVVYSVSHIL